MVPSFIPVAILRPFLAVEHHYLRAHQKLEGRFSDCALGMGMEKICTPMYTRLLLDIGTIVLKK